MLNSSTKSKGHNEITGDGCSKTSVESDVSSGLMLFYKECIAGSI